MRRLFLDLETFNERPITVGTHAYAETAEVMLFAYAFDDGPVKVWDVTEGGATPRELRDALEQAPEVWAHNSGFDRTVLAHSQWPAAAHAARQVERWRDTLVAAYMHSLPGALGDLCALLGVESEDAKDARGKALVRLFCSPRKFKFPAFGLKVKHFADRKAYRAARFAYDAEKAAARAAWPGRATRETHPTEWAEFVGYAGSDIKAMRAVAKKLPAWNHSPEEVALWHLDQRINDRGFAVDLALARGAVAAVTEDKEALAERTQELTDGAVQSATQRDALLAHLLQAFGVDLPDLRKDTLERRLNDPDLPPELRELLAVRLSAGAASTSKYKALLKAVSADGRLRGTLQFCGATRTGRWAGRLFQPQNLPRVNLKPEQIATGIEAFTVGAAEIVLDDVTRYAVNAVRGCIVAPRGRKLVVADLSNIEGRVLAWLAGERWKLKAFADFDAGVGEDLYKVAYGSSFGVDPKTVDKEQRQIGKVQELMLGYEGGVGAYVTGAATYRIDLETMAEKAWPTLSLETRDEVESFLAWARKKGIPRYGLSDKVYMVCDAFKRLWRGAHPKTTQFWRDLENACINAVSIGETTQVGRLTVDRKSGWLRVRLPSGRFLCYPKAHLRESGEKVKLYYSGTNPYSKRFGPIGTYGGKLVENVTQAVARDVIAAGLVNAERDGFQTVLSVHDELITEAPDTSEFTSGRLAGCMTDAPQWAAGLPLAAAGFEAYRYRKE